MTITVEPWKSVYKKKTDHELLARAKQAGWVYLRGERFACFNDSWGWKNGNCLSGGKTSNPADYLRAKEHQSRWHSNELFTDLMFEHDLDCTYCGRPICFDAQDTKDQMLREQKCATCVSWHNTLGDKKIWVCETEDHELRVYEVPSDYNSKGNFLGFGGAKWCLMKLDGTYITGNNLWHTGDLHPIYMPIVKQMGILTFCKPDSIPQSLINAFTLESYKIADWLEENGRPNTAKFYTLKNNH